MTREEAIFVLENNKPTTDPRMCRVVLCRAVDIAIDALEKQIPKKPTQDLRKGLECYCPICGAYVGWRDALASDLANFCSDCGQAIMPFETDTNVGSKEDNE